LAAALSGSIFWQREAMGVGQTLPSSKFLIRCIHESTRDLRGCELTRTTKWHMFFARMAASAISTEVEALADLEAVPREELIDAISHGLPSSMVRELANRMLLPLEQMAELLRLTSRTLQRRLEDGHLELAESERLWELSRLFLRATEV